MTNEMASIRDLNSNGEDGQESCRQYALFRDPEQYLLLRRAGKLLNEVHHRGGCLRAMVVVYDVRQEGVGHGEILSEISVGLADHPDSQTWSCVCVRVKMNGGRFSVTQTLCYIFTIFIPSL